MGTNDRGLYLLKVLEKKLCTLGSLDRSFVSDIRQFLNDEDLLNRGKLFNFRRRGFPMAFIEGAAAGYLLCEQDDGGKAFSLRQKESSRRMYGLSFDEVIYDCFLSINEEEKQFWDAETVISYRGPYVERPLKETFFHVERTSLGNFEDDIATNMSVEGQGLSLVGDYPTQSIVQVFQGGKKPLSYIKTDYQVKVSRQRVKQDREISFRFNEKKVYDGGHLRGEYLFGFFLDRPADKVTFRLHVPDIFRRHSRICSVRMVALEGTIETGKKLVVPDLLTGPLLGHISCPHQQGVYEWSLTDPQLLGISYVMALSTSPIL